MENNFPPTENHCSGVIIQFYMEDAIIFPILQTGKLKLWQVVAHLMCGRVLSSFPSTGVSRPLGNRTVECTPASALDHLGPGSFHMLSPKFLSSGGEKRVAFKGWALQLWLEARGLLLLFSSGTIIIGMGEISDYEDEFLVRGRPHYFSECLGIT